MSQIIVTFLIALACLCSFLVFFLRQRPLSSHTAARVLSIEGLLAVHTRYLDVLLARDDYDKLRTRSELKPVREKLWRDRRRAVLIWLDDLKRDVRVLWEFRRFLVSHGLPVRFREEFAINFLAWLALLYLSFARATVFVFGPFSFSRVLRSARMPVERLSTRGATLLARFPSDIRARIERDWVRQVAVLEFR